MRRPLVVANWKMHKTVGESLDFVRSFRDECRWNDFCQVVLCPPFTSLYPVAQALQGTNITLGAQDLFWKDQGAYTGEISPLMLKDVGCQFVIIGHSERRGRFGKPDPELQEGELRSFFSESDQSVHKKILSAVRHQIRPIFCVGETLQEREEGITEEVIARQLGGGLTGAGADQMALVSIAYEPVWAIGTGKVCDASEAQRICRLIRDRLAEGFGRQVAESIRILYGGSITPENIEGLASQPDIDGGLVGGASLNPDSFCKIVEIVDRVRGRRAES